MVTEVTSASPAPTARPAADAGRAAAAVLTATGAPPPATPPAQSGNALPQGGEKPPVESAPKVEIKLPDITRAIQNLNQFLESSRRSLSFRIDQASGRTVITVLNPETKEVVRQIPPEEVLIMARTLRQAGIL